MGKVSIDLSSFKAAGVYTLEIDNSQRSSETTNALRMIVGFSNKGPFNRPVLLESDADRLAIFGDVDTKLEHKGCYFNRMLRTLLTNGPVIALNLLKVDNDYKGKDQVNYAAMSLDAATENPVIKEMVEKYGEYDYLSESVDNTIYGTVKGDVIPFIGTTPYSSVYNRSRFWTPDKDLVTVAAARGLDSADAVKGYSTYEHTNFLNFANVGTEEFSILVFKPGNMAGYDVTAESWYGGKENIPFGWVRPYDYISDYFLQVVCVKGNWTNYPVLSTDPVWGGYFDKKGVIKEKINSFLGAEGITVLGSWTGIIIPDFTDKQGNNLSLERKINSATERTGLLMSFNLDAANVLTYDYSGQAADEEDPEQGCWGLDIDGNAEIEDVEDKAPFIVDMVGHGAFVKKEEKTIVWEPTELKVDVSKGCKIQGKRAKKYSVDSSLMKLMDLSTCNPNVVSVYDEDGVTLLSNDLSTGIYVDPSMLVFETVAEPMEVTDNNIKSVINPTYYTIMEGGAPVAAKVSAETIVIVDQEEEEVEATLNYGDVQARLSFSLVFDADEKIVGATFEGLEIAKENKVKGEVYNGVTFLSYNYISEEGDEVSKSVSEVKYFSDITLWGEDAPVNEDVKNMFIITSAEQWEDEMIKVGDYVHNITYNNEIGETNQYKVIPGLARVIKKQFIKVDGSSLTYKGKEYKYYGKADTAKNGNHGFYLVTCTAPVLVENEKIIRQLSINEDAISHSLRFIPMKGLQLSSRHRPGYDADGNLGVEEGIEKIYSVLEEQGINRGLMNPAMVEYRYIIDSMSYGLENELGGKVHISRVASERGKCTAILNMPSAKQFAVSTNPYFCDSYIPGVETRPGLNTKYIAAGGNTEMGSEAVFSLPTEDDGAKFTACFWPNVIYTENGKTISMPPAADVANVLNRKFTGVNDPYCICANQNGILSNKYLTGLEFLADRTDREYLEPFGVNTIIKERGDIMIYGNQTAFQAIKSDLNKLHVRENLNTAEIECEAVLKKYNFLYNTAATRANIVAQLTPILQVMQTSGALAQYEIICDESNNTAEVIEADCCVVEINLWFNHGMEKIVQKFTINRYASLGE